jgi:hypothetical protein
MNSADLKAAAANRISLQKKDKSPRRIKTPSEMREIQEGLNASIRKWAADRKVGSLPASFKERTRGHVSA